MSRGEIEQREVERRRNTGPKRLKGWRARFLSLHNLIREMAAVRNSLTDRLRTSSAPLFTLHFLFFLGEGKGYTQRHTHV